MLRRELIRALFLCTTLAASCALSVSAVAYNPLAKRIDTDTSEFDGALSESDTTVQRALETLDDAVGGKGTVDSVALTVPDFLLVSGSPVTSSGTLTVSVASQAANLVFSGPTNGASAAPTFRSLVDADIPNNITIDLATAATSATSATTATALSANGANCSAGQAAGGVSASGAAEDCTTYLQTETDSAHDSCSEISGCVEGALTAVTADSPLAGSGTSGSHLTISTSGTWSGNAGTASALAADPANCSVGSVAGGVTAAGVAESCLDPIVSTEIDTANELAGIMTEVTGSGNFVRSTGPTITSPIISTSILDTNANSLALLTATTSAVNQFTVANAAVNTNPTLSSTGSDSNIGINLTAKGTGGVVVTSTNAGPSTITHGLTVNTSAGTATTDQFIVTMPASETVTAGATITANGCGTIKRVTAASGVTTSTTDTFTTPAAANAGCIMHVCNVGAQTITLDSNSNFITGLAGVATDVSLTANDCVTVGSTGSGGAWYKISTEANN